MGSSQLFVCLALLFLSVATSPTLQDLHFLKPDFLHEDPEVYQNITEIIRSKHYPCEDHTVVTDDGYILSLQRIPHGKAGPSNAAARPPVFLQHGLLDSSHTWANNLENESLAFILADAGFDVWLGNSRGNTYSSRHKTLSPDSKEFWDFSWDEMAEFDLPACLYYVLSQTGAAKLSYVGHSQGTEIAFARFSSDPVLSSHVSAFVALGPVATQGYVESPIRYVAPFTTTLEHVLEWFGNGRFLPSSVLMKVLGEILCEKGEVPIVCSNIIFLLAGFDQANTNMSRLPVYVSHTPAGTSVQNVVHYSQGIMSKKFQKFDFGYKGNMAHYGQPTPPLYSVGNLTVPTAFFWGGKDWLADPTDAAALLAQISGAVKLNRFLPLYNHMDFVWGMDAGSTIYREIVSFLKAYQSAGDW